MIWSGHCGYFLSKRASGQTRKISYLITVSLPLASLGEYTWRRTLTSFILSLPEDRRKSSIFSHWSSLDLAFEHLPRSNGKNDD